MAWNFQYRLGNQCETIMKWYLLLRNNQQTGPYSLKELITLDLTSTDLIWIEGSSTAWSYPYELDEFKSSIKPQPPKCSGRNRPTRPAKSRHIFVALPYAYAAGNTEAIPAEEPELETRFRQSYDDMKAVYAQRLQERKKAFRKKHRDLRPAWWVTGLFAGIIGCAFLVKNIVDGFDDTALTDTDVATAVALPTHMDGSNITSAPEKEDGPSSEYHNALATEPAWPTGNRHMDMEQSTVMPQATSHEERKAVKPKNITHQVSVQGNDYHVGVFGGVQDLKLTIHNNSHYTLDDVTVKVAFLKPNGQTVKEAVYEVKGVPAKGMKTLNVPASNRGVKVIYQIVAVKSKSYSQLLET